MIDLLKWATQTDWANAFSFLKVVGIVGAGVGVGYGIWRLKLWADTIPKGQLLSTIIKTAKDFFVEHVVRPLTAAAKQAASDLWKQIKSRAGQVARDLQAWGKSLAKELNPFKGFKGGALSKSFGKWKPFKVKRKKKKWFW